MSMQTTANPLNGEEIRDITKIRLDKIVDAIPLLKRGNTFKFATIGFGFTMTAFPADVPVPEDFDIEFDLLPPVQSEEERELLEKEIEIRKTYVDSLNEKRAKIVLALESLDELIEKHALIVEEFVEIDTGKSPDKARIEHGMDIPVIKDVGGGKRAEVFVKPNTLKLKGRN